MDVLILVMVLMFGAVMLVSIGEKLRLPWPALMVVLATAVGFVPAWREINVDPHLILPLFLPPLLFATAQRTSWAMFRLRWRAVVVLALLLTSLSIAAVAGVVAALVPGVTVAAAVAIAAAVAPPDPVAVEAVAGPVGIPRRLITTLQSEGLFNDAVAIVVFTAAISAVQTDRPFGADVLGEFALGIVLAFGVYLAAEEIGASGVVAVVIAAVQIASMRAGDEVEERLSGKAFWDVIELLVTGVAFGLVGIEVFVIISEAGPDLGRMLAHAAVVCGVIVALRAAWMMALLLFRRAHDPWTAPRTWREALVLTWSGMRGLATLALALAIPVVAADGTQVAAREELLVIAATVVVGTLVLPALTLPWLVRLLGIGGAHDAEQEAEHELARRAGRAALAAVQDRQVDLPEPAVARLEEFLSQLGALAAGETSLEYAERVRGFRERQQALNALRAEALAAARAEVLRARQEPGVDPEAADRVLRMLDLQSRSMRP